LRAYGDSSIVEAKLAFGHAVGWIELTTLA
jgi:hypothetical protein